MMFTLMVLLEIVELLLALLDTTANGGFIADQNKCEGKSEGKTLH